MWRTRIHAFGKSLFVEWVRLTLIRSTWGRWIFNEPSCRNFSGTATGACRRAQVAGYDFLYVGNVVAFTRSSSNGIHSDRASTARCDDEIRIVLRVRLDVPSSAQEHENVLLCTRQLPSSRLRQAELPLSFEQTFFHFVVSFSFSLFLSLPLQLCYFPVFTANFFCEMGNSNACKLIKLN